MPVIAGFAIATAIAACAVRGQENPDPFHLRKKNEITALWTQIRDWRREARMEVEPPAAMIQSIRGKTVRQAGNVCPDHVPPPACTEICDLAGAICDNAENICGIAGELGGDPWAREKCDNAKASCKEAQQRCCDCDVEPASAAEPAP
jgi:hypothetical protein